MDISVVGMLQEGHEQRLPAPKDQSVAVGSKIALFPTRGNISLPCPIGGIEVQVVSLNDDGSISVKME